ncbi:hypothetical protein D9M72_650400 [compost metagenome]
MPLGVVDLLEVVQVEHEASPRLQLLLREFGQVATVEGAGQRIADRHFQQLALLQVLGGDVLCVTQHVRRVSFGIEHVVIRPVTA